MERTGNQTERETLILGALLHDIGKFWQRTEDPEKKQEVERRFSAGKYSHSWWSTLFVENYSYLFSDPEFAQHLVQFHHNPNSCPETWYGKIIHIADRLSAMEREEREEGEEKSRGKSTTPLVSIFSQIRLNKELPPLHYYCLSSLDLKKERIFPKTDVLINKDDYKELWQKFTSELQNIKNKDDIFTIYYLLQKYTWCIASSTRTEERPDISLFDHLKTTAAITTCLFIDEAEEKSLDILDNILTRATEGSKSSSVSTEATLVNERRFLLLGGDICGIQKFIYNLTAKGATKGLKGRSFYIQLLSETISKYLLSKLKLSLPNLLYCGGGRFYILAPVSKEESLSKIYTEISEKLLSLHQGELHIVLDSTYLSPADFRRIDQGWDGLKKKLMTKKKHKFREILDTKYEDIFVKLEEGGEKDFCEICGSEKSIKVEEGISKCGECRKFEKIAKYIRDLGFLVEIRKQVQGTDLHPYPFPEFDTCYYMVSSKPELEKLLESILNTATSVYSINTTDFLSAYNKNKNINWGFKFLAKHTPLRARDKDVKTFKDFAQESRGIKKWAVLRMDVDSLGKIFAQGLKDRATISRVSTLSSMFSLYFAGWIEKITQDNDKVYVLYSGGDDLFIVGSWHAIPGIAKNIYQHFKEFTCQNQNITLSGGIYIAPVEKFPLFKAAELAGDILDTKSKSLKDKDGLTFLDTPVKWEYFEEEERIKDKIVECIKQKSVSRALLYSLMETIYVENELKDKGKVPLWRVWKFFYVIKRFMERYKGAQRELLELEEYFRPWLKNKPKSYGAAAIRWAEFMTRKEG